MSVPFIKVAAGIIWKGDKFLAAFRPQDGPRGGFWEFPGGKKEKGENMEETLIRELEEELNIKCGEIVPFKVIEHLYSDMRVELHFMHVLSFKGEPEALLGQEINWVRKSEALGMNFLPADIKNLAELQKPSF